MTAIFSSVIRLNYYSTQLKYPKIIMILKPDKRENEVTSYRPISLLPVISKLFKGVVLKRLLPILKDKNIILDHQFGFKNVTPEQCRRIVQEITKALENKLYWSAVFLHISKSFQKVWQSHGLYKIKQLLPTPYYFLFKSYLRNRSFYVHINGEDSSFGVIKSGIPLGSVLGEILYTIYTLDMPINHELTIATCADDTAFLSINDSSFKASEMLQNQLNIIETWLQKRNIKVNTEKSVHVTFNLRIGDCPKSNNVNYLGLHLDRRLP